MRVWSLNDWSIRTKVAAIVALPLVVAISLGALRIESVVTDAADLSASADRYPRISETFNALDRAVADMASTGVPAPDSFLQTSSQFDGDLESVNDSAQFRNSVTGFQEALSDAEGLRVRLQSGPVPAADRAAIADKMRASIASLTNLGLSSLVDGLSEGRSIPRALGTALNDSLEGRRAAQTQQLLTSEPDRATSGLVNRSLGRERASLAGLSIELGAESPEIRELRALLDSRLNEFAEPNANMSEANASAQRSAEIYDAIGLRVAGQMGDALAEQAADRRQAAWIESALVLAAILAALALTLLVARSLTRPIRRLREGALNVAHHALPDEIEKIRMGGDVPEVTPVPVHTSEEIGQLARAVDDIHEEALYLAGEQTRLRLQVGNMFETLSRRSRSLVDHQLALIEELERDEEDPRRLDSLFRLDHLATRMRRNGANLMVLAGTQPRRNPNDQPVPLDTIISAAISEVEDYRRVSVVGVPDAAFAATAAADMVHLVAELVDNALRYSPPSSPVVVTAARAVAGGMLLEIVDRGLGMPAADIDDANDSLDFGGEVTPETARRMGLFVVGRLAQRHDVTVRLRATSDRGGKSGLTVSVHVPANLIVTTFPADGHGPPSDHGSAVASSARPGGSPLRTVGTGYSAEVDTDEAPVASPVASRRHDTDGTYPELTAAKLPRRRPGASGVDDLATSARARPSRAQPPPDREVLDPPSNTSAFFKARNAVHAGSRSNTGYERGGPPTNDVDRLHPVPSRAVPPEPNDDVAPDAPAVPAQVMPIYERMVSEWLLDPTAPRSQKGTWSTAADAGWAAASATQEPVTRRTGAGLPAREPGARLIPGAVARPDSGGVARRPEAVREKFASHFAGVRAGRSEGQTRRHRMEEDR